MTQPQQFRSTEPEEESAGTIQQKQQRKQTEVERLRQQLAQMEAEHQAATRRDHILYNSTESEGEGDIGK